MTIRLHLLCAASTPSIRSAGFPADEPLDPLGRKSLSHFSGRFPSFDKILRSPALSAAQTAEGLGLDAASEAALRDCDFGRWAGRGFGEIEEQDSAALMQWIRDPQSAPHGGESFADVLRRVGGWMESLQSQSGSILAISHPTILRAAIAFTMEAGAEALRRIDIAPLSRVVLSRAGGWSLKALIPAKEAD